MSGYDAWKPRSPDDRVDFDEDDECDHVGYTTGDDGRRHCAACGESWQPTRTQLAVERAVARDNERWHRRQSRRALWRKVWQRLLGKRAARRDDVDTKVPF